MQGTYQTTNTTPTQKKKKKHPQKKKKKNQTKKKKNQQHKKTAKKNPHPPNRIREKKGESNLLSLKFWVRTCFPRFSKRNSQQEENGPGRKNKTRCGQNSLQWRRNWGRSQTPRSMGERSPKWAIYSLHALRQNSF